MTTPAAVDPTTLTQGVNYLWVLVVSFLIFFMQPGFALLEAGQVRAKNVGNVLMKNMTDWALGVLVYFVVGAGVAAVAGALTTPGGDLSGAFAYLGAGGSAWLDWLFGAVFAMTAATIVSGAVAERMDFRAYVLFAAVVTGLIYPVVQGMAWGGNGLISGAGYLGEAVGAGYLDFAGATVVHMCGGVAGLVGAYMVGPRRGRFDAAGDSRAIPGHSMLLAVLGTLVLAFGWYGFNVGTQWQILTVDDGALVFEGGALGRVALVTTLGMGAGAVAAMLISTRWQGKPDPLWTANGLLAGLVAVTGAVPHVTWWGGALLGALGGALVLPAFRFTVDTLHVDDVCGVFAVHGVAGAVGTALIPFVGVQGGSWAFLGVDQLAIQVVGIAVIAGWTVAASATVFKLGDALFGLRVTETEEREGLDEGEHGVMAYPEFVEGGPEPSAPEAVTDGGAVETDGGGIKLVMAVVRPDRLSEVKRALAAVGAPSLTVTNVSGRGSQPAKTEQWRGEEYTVDLHQKVKVECVVADVPAADVVDAVREAAHTGDPGDGKVFVLPVESATQVRTGNVGTEAV